MGILTDTGAEEAIKEIFEQVQKVAVLHGICLHCDEEDDDADEWLDALDEALDDLTEAVSDYADTLPYETLEEGESE